MKTWAHKPRFLHISMRNFSKDDERFEMVFRSTTLPYKNLKEADFANLNYAISMSDAK